MATTGNTMESSIAEEPPRTRDDGPGITALGIAAVLLRWRRVIVVLGIAGGLLGFVQAYSGKRVYKSTATFLPQSSETGPSGLAQAAGQLGIWVPAGGSGWGPEMYVILLRSRALLEPIAVDTFAIAEEGGRRAALSDLLAVEAAPPSRRIEITVETLKSVVVPRQDQDLGAVTVTVNHGNHTRDFTYVDDIVEGVIRASDDVARPDSTWDSGKPDPASSNAPYRVFNIGNNSPVKLSEYISALEEALGKLAIKNLLPMQPGDVPDTFADVSELERQVGYRPATPVREGVRAFVKWYREFHSV